ncbi:hypothetical protein LCGC14_1831940 [marine sediment metagenome]|uniref:Uncharacterized protein n=1 Tax=marine sediment metagenome TaxID=412755 RepID=A0A0F9GFR7_9ZZZZ|nr:hypothetical protein [Candidatus Aminicenantes bacterium]
MGTTNSFKQERPFWCGHLDCLFLRRVMDSLCGGQLPSPEPHEGDLNTHHICIRTDTVFDLQVNFSDLDWFRWVFDALDGKKTSGLSSGGKNS